MASLYRKFVPLPDTSRPELAASLCHGNFSFDDMGCPLLTIWDCRNDRDLYGFSESFHGALDPVVRAPLWCPGEIQSCSLHNCPQPGLTLCSFLTMMVMTPHVIVSTSSTRTVHFSAMADLAKSPQEILTMTLLMRGKIYITTRNHLFHDRTISS